jgi:hypothetical protein
MAVNSEDTTLEAQRHFERGVDLYFEERFDDAAGELLLAIKSAPEPFIEAERWLGHAYRCSVETPEQLMKTIQQYEKIVSLDPNDVGSWCSLALMAEIGTAEREDLAKSAGEAYMESNGYRAGTITQAKFLSKHSSVKRQAGKLREIAREASAQAEQRFAALDPERDSSEDILYALDGAVMLADFYRDESQTSKAAGWYKMASQVNIDALQDLSEEDMMQARDLKAQAERRHALLEEELKQAIETRKRKTKTILIVIAVVVFLLLLACLICSGGLGLFD